VRNFERESRDTASNGVSLHGNLCSYNSGHVYHVFRRTAREAQCFRVFCSSVHLHTYTLIINSILIFQKLGVTRLQAGQHSFNYLQELWRDFFFSFRHRVQADYGFHPNFYPMHRRALSWG